MMRAGDEGKEEKAMSPRAVKAQKKLKRRMWYYNEVKDVRTLFCACALVGDAPTRVLLVRHGAHGSV
jgi:hypothetical protein